LACRCASSSRPVSATRSTQAKALICGLSAQWVLGDTAFDADHFRADIAAINAQAVIPSHPSRACKLPLDEHIYKERHLVECCFNMLKHFRRVVTRYEKTARNFLAIITVAAIGLVAPMTVNRA